MSSANQPFPASESGLIFRRYRWPVSWITLPDVGEPPFVLGFRLIVDQAQDAIVRCLVSADERYELYLDGERLACGPERGSAEAWYYDTVKLFVKAGRHVLFARVWALGEKAPFAQCSVRAGFLLGVEEISTGGADARWSTGLAPWEVKRIGGYEWIEESHIPFDDFTGKKLRMQGRDYPWGIEKGDGEGWLKAVVNAPANTFHPTDLSPIRLLTPGTLPQMMHRRMPAGQVRFVEEVSGIEKIREHRIDQKNHLPEIARQIQALLESGAALHVPPHTRYRAIIDFRDYFCAYPQIRVSQGNEGRMEIRWAEALFVNISRELFDGRKGNRNDIDGNYFDGHGDAFVFHGRAHCAYTTLWWEAGRYLELLIETRDEELIVEELAFAETRYPLERESTFSTDDPRLEKIAPILLRSVQVNAHETFMDCPYYEQLCYTGDTLIDCLVVYTNTGDARLVRKSLQLFHDSRLAQGLTQSRFPCRIRQFIPPFSLIWVSMLRNHAWWRGEPEFIRSLLPGARAVIDAHLHHVNSNGLLTNLRGWNFLDWVEGWEAGTPPDADQGKISGPLNWLFVYALQAITELETFAGEPELVARYSRLAQAHAQTIEKVFWNEERGLFADDVGHRHYSEHAQCLAILSGRASDEHKTRAAEGLLRAPDLKRCTIYFTHYFFETLHKLNQSDALFLRLEDWLNLLAMGFVTTPEQPEPSRSDCHAWGSHPLYHYYATILGIRPATMGFDELEIRPQLGPLHHAKGRMVHPRGWIEVDFKRVGERLEGAIILPEGVTGIFYGGKNQQPLKPGTQTVSA
jgi:alpha-L-rhamnosidase